MLIGRTSRRLCIHFLPPGARLKAIRSILKSASAWNMRLCHSCRNAPVSPTSQVSVCPLFPAHRRVFPSIVPKYMQERITGKKPPATAIRSFGQAHAGSHILSTDGWVIATTPGPGDGGCLPHFELVADARHFVTFLYQLQLLFDSSP